MNPSSKEKLSHQVFQSTYLRKVVFSLDFDRLLTEDSYAAIGDCIRTNFGFEVTKEFLENLSNRPLAFGTEDHAVQWSISDAILEIIITQEQYHSFEITLLPLINLAQSFLKSVNREAKEITLNKINLIPVTLSSYADLKANVEQVFTEAILSQWQGEVYQQNESTLIYFSKKKNAPEEEIVTYSGFISKDGVNEGQPARYILDITATYTEKITYDLLEDIAISLNDEIYKVFINSVSEELKQSMEGV